MQYLDAFMSGEGDLRVLTACPFCHANYTIRAARVIAQKEDSHIVHIECRQCGGSIVALIVAGGVDAQSIGVITDLAHGEVARFSKGRAITADDAIDIHTAVSDPAILTHLFSSLS